MERTFHKNQADENIQTTGQRQHQNKEFDFTQFG